MTTRFIRLCTAAAAAVLVFSGCDQRPEKKAPAAPPAASALPPAPVPSPATASAPEPEPSGPARISRGPYPQAPTADSMHLVWRIRQKTKPSVRYGLKPGELTATAGEKHIIIRRLASEWKHSPDIAPLHSAPSGTRQYEARLTGLMPDTLYYYAVYDDGNRLTPEDASYSFRTLPAPGTDRPLLLWVVGDSGTGNKVQADVHSSYRAWLGKEKREADAFIHVGDMAYNSGLDSEFQGYFFKTYEQTLRNTVCWPAFGNHEGRTSKGPTGRGPYFDAYITPTAGESGGLPSGNEGYYSFDIGRVHFISLNSYDVSRSANAPMAQWLKADLEKTKAAWIVAFFHHPPYTKGSHDSDDPKKDKELIEMRENIMPILEAGGTDLTLTGHSHIYERSMLLDGAYTTPTVATNAVLQDGEGSPAAPYRKNPGITPNDGSVSVVTGHGGATLGRKKAPSPVMRVSIMEFGSVLLEINGDTLTGRMINVAGQERDTFQISKKEKVTQQRLAAPWQPPPFTGPEKVTVPSAPSTQAPAAEKTFPHLPEKFTSVIPKNATWEYLAGAKPPADWTTTTGGGWKTGDAGFGYGDGDDVTKFDDMPGKYSYLCVRREFEIKEGTDVSSLGLAVAYDDGFICYLNGTEVLRENVKGSLDTASGVANHEANRNFKHFPIRSAKTLLKPGKNILAIEIHNDELKSSDLTLNPFLILAGGDGEPDDD